MPGFLEALAHGRELPKMPTYGRNVQTAVLYLKTDGVPCMDNSPKVARFRANLLGDESVVTVDRHAARLASGRRGFTSMSLGQYRAIERAYQLAAGTVGVTPARMQSGTWEFIRTRPDVVSGLRGLRGLGV